MIRDESIERRREVCSRNCTPLVYLRRGADTFSDVQFHAEVPHRASQLQCNGYSVWIDWIDQKVWYDKGDSALFEAWLLKIRLMRY